MGYTQELRTGRHVVYQMHIHMKRVRAWFRETRDDFGLPATLLLWGGSAVFVLVYVPITAWLILYLGPSVGWLSERFFWWQGKGLIAAGVSLGSFCLGLALARAHEPTPRRRP